MKQIVQEDILKVIKTFKGMDIYTERELILLKSSENICRNYLEFTQEY